MFGLDQHCQTLVLNIYLYQRPSICSGGRNSNATPAQSPVVGGNFTRNIMNIDDFDFHDSQILSVTENTQDHHLDFLLNFPTNWQNNIFEKRTLRFTEVIFYNIDEIPFYGQPTILEIINFGQVNKSWGSGRSHIEARRTKIEIKTNAGNRIIEYKDCSLIIPTT